MSIGQDDFDPRSPLELMPNVNIVIGYATPPGAWRNRQPVPITRTPDELVREFASGWNTPAKEPIVEAMRRGDWISKGTKSPSSIINAFKQVLAVAQLRNESYEDVLASSVSGDDESRRGSGGPFRSETTSVTEYDATNVTDIANNAARQRLGRAATKKERELLATALNEAQRKSPMVTISEGTTAGGTMSGADGQRTARGTVSTTTQRGGIDAAEIAAEQTVKAEDFEERFFVSAFTDMLKDLAKPAV
jgi:hypothetical protein